MRHPAKFSDPIMEVIADALDLIVTAELTRVADEPRLKVLDPFAGSGRIHELAGPHVCTVGVELEPEFAHIHPHTLVGNALYLPFSAGYFDVVITSPAYGNRLADSFKPGPTNPWTYHSYSFSLGRSLHPENGGKYYFHQQKYKDLHAAAWREATRALRRGGWFILNVSDYVRAGEVVPVTDWHLDQFLSNGYELIERLRVTTRRLRHGANRVSRVGHEDVLVMRRPT